MSKKNSKSSKSSNRKHQAAFYAFHAACTLTVLSVSLSAPPPGLASTTDSSAASAAAATTAATAAAATTGTGTTGVGGTGSSAGTAGTGGISAPTAPTGGTGGFNLGNFLGNLGQGLGEFGQKVDEFLSPIEKFITQIRNFREQVFGRLRRVIGQGRSELSGVVRDAMGVLNLPDPDELFRELFVDNDRNKEFDRNSLGQINPTVARSLALSALNTETARLDASTILSKNAQEQMATETRQLQTWTNAALEQGRGSGSLSSQSSTAAQQSDQLSQRSSQIAEESKTRVSTQDAIKDLNQIAGNVSGQLTQLSSQSAAQAGQLSNISGQLGYSVGLEGRQLLRLNQVVTGVAVANQNIADMNEVMQGERRIRLAENNAQLYRSLQIGRLGYRMNLGSNRSKSKSSQDNSGQ